MSIGRVVAGKYELIERIGSGTFFQVFKGRDHTTGRQAAVKFLLPEVADDRFFVAALADSVHGAASLLHPSIAAVYEVAEEDGLPVIISEFVRGINLKERIRRIAPFTVSVAVDFAIAVCEALQYAHAEGMVHGDLRPQNIIASPDGVVKVTDFGLARAIVASPDAVARNLSKAVHYQAPEASGQGVIMPVTDLYALGVILYEMLTGTLPYPADSPIMVASRHQNDPVPSPREQNAGVPRALDGIVRKAMQKRPADRYGTASDMLADLKRVRDALRFGRPTAWSPMESVETVQQVQPRPAAPKPRVPETPPAVPAAPEVKMPVPRESTGIHPVLRGALMLMGLAVLVMIFLGVGLWMASFTRPSTAVFPDLVGKPIEEARALAEKLQVRLIEREEYNDQYEPGIVYRVDYEPGRPIRPGRTVLTWVSKGSRLVWVPDVAGLSAAEAEEKLKDAGLALGQVDRTNNDSVPFGVIVSQNPRSGKRVDRETPVNLVISDGPAEQSGVAAAPSTESADAEHVWDITHRVRRDGKGSRQVRIEYEDALGTSTVFDDVRNEGDEIKLNVRAQGPTITVRVYYADDPTPVSERVVPWKGGE
jgi:serine/threonine-protein kinase